LKSGINQKVLTLVLFSIFIFGIRVLAGNDGSHPRPKFDFKTVIHPTLGKVVVDPRGLSWGGILGGVSPFGTPYEVYTYEQAQSLCSHLHSRLPEQFEMFLADLFLKTVVPWQYVGTPQEIPKFYEISIWSSTLDTSTTRAFVHIASDQNVKQPSDDGYRSIETQFAARCVVDPEVEKSSEAE
jgi:hypothetical protein